MGEFHKTKKALTLTFSFIAASLLIVGLGGCEKGATQSENDASDTQAHTHEFGAYQDTNDGVYHQRVCLVCGYQEKGMHEAKDDNGDCIYCEASGLFTGEGYTVYVDLDEDSCCVSKYDTNKSRKDEALFIPSTHNGKTVTRIGKPDATTSTDSAFLASTDLSSFEYNYLHYVSIPSSVTTIGQYAFAYGCTLTDISIPNSVTEIGDYAFHYCMSITSMNIPDSVKSIGDYTFYLCFSLRDISLGDKLTTIGVSAFYGCSSLTSITIPDNVSSIGGNAFAYDYSLTSIVLPASIKSIGDCALYDNYSLTFIFYKGSPEAYKQIEWTTTDGGNYILGDSDMIYYYDEDNLKPYDEGDNHYQYWFFDSNGNPTISSD